MAISNTLFQCWNQHSYIGISSYKPYQWESTCENTMHIFSNLRSDPQWALQTGFLTIPGAVLASALILLGTFPLIKRFPSFPAFCLFFFGHTYSTKTEGWQEAFITWRCSLTQLVAFPWPSLCATHLVKKRHRSFGLTTQADPTTFCNALTKSLRLLQVPRAFAYHRSVSYPAAWPPSSTGPATSYQDREGSIASHDERVKAFFFFYWTPKAAVWVQKTLGHDVPGPHFQLLRRRRWLRLASYNWFNWQDTFFNTPAEPSGWTRTGSTGSGTY